jgi:hypothetical protein
MPKTRLETLKQSTSATAPRKVSIMHQDNTHTTNTTVEQQPFALTLFKPFSSFSGGEPTRIPYVIDGLLPQAGFSILGGKPKHGKSSLARYEAVCVAKGQRFLGREVERGEVLLISLEDPTSHVDNCLKALKWNPETDAMIHIATKLSPDINKSISAIEKALRENPKITLVIVDTLAKLLRIRDMDKYGEVLPQIEKVHDLARKFPQVHIQGLAHSKKVRTDDPFDGLLGSTALRGEPDTNIALFDEEQQRVIASETRIGRNIPPTILEANLVDIAGADVVKDFYLGEEFAVWQQTKGEKAERNRRVTYEERIINYLGTCEGFSAKLTVVLENVTGNRKLKLEAIESLAKAGVITTSGEKHSPTNPTVLHLNEKELASYRLLSRFGDADTLSALG